MNKTTPSKAIGSAIAGIVIFFVVIAFIAIIGSNDDAKKNDDFVAATQTTVVTESNEPNIVYEDDSISVEFIDIHTIDYLAGTFLKLKITNKSDIEIKYGIDDIYVNDSAVLSGIIATKSVEPGKNIIESYSMLTSDLGIDVKDITKVEFVVTGQDNSYHNVYTSNKITIERYSDSYALTTEANIVTAISSDEE